MTLAKLPRAPSRSQIEFATLIAVSVQPGIAADLSPLGRFVTLQMTPDADPNEIIARLGRLECEGELVVGLGEPLVLALGHKLEGLRTFPALTGPGFAVPSTQAALWCWLRGDDRGELLHATRDLLAEFDEVLELEGCVDGFVHGGGRDLTGYEDGTENPTGEAAHKAAFDDYGGSFVAVQQWLHDFYAFEELSEAARDNVIGRRLADNEELEDAPASAHIRRTAQEEFEPDAFLLRRSMPWTEQDTAGLMFVAFGANLDVYETHLRRMVGLTDGIVDGLFRFSRPLTGGYYWCPPLRGGALDLTGLG